MLMAIQDTTREQPQAAPQTRNSSHGGSPSAAPARSRLLLVGVNHETAPIGVRERIAIPTSRLAEATRKLVEQPGVREAMIVSTCNRVELLTVHDPASASEELAATERVMRFFDEFFQVSQAELKAHIYERQEQEAVNHLFRVASSLDSMVVGDAQILGQVKHAWNVAREVGAIHSAEASDPPAQAGAAHASSVLDPLLQRAFFVAKRVRTETQVGSSNVSVASVAAELARNIFGSLAGKTILMVGAGKMSELTARHLIQQGANTLLVSNRTEARAEKIADGLRTPAITTGIIPFNQLHEQAHRADIILTSTGAAALGGGAIFTPANARAMQQRRKNRPVFFIDIAVPRDVSPDVNKVDGCFVYDIDDLQEVAVANQENRSREAAAAESIVKAEVEAYRERLSLAPAAEAIKQLLADADATRQQELAKLTHRLAGQPLSPEQLATIESAMKAFAAKLLHPQIAALKAAQKQRGE
ncbi:glutamyl-tRNA reductase [Bryocella elongata]|uniref:Glutamyl-tRNA reductase n=1 Tax=Bryocella elongata TaxID=863522 RepID=A0A1H5UAP1_9BACT|nr:glutamyl-tRNA reductase [Bryocella elongata]SEF71391.1 glutamyl-tRNA reductase [Bryocella elongata]